MKVEENTQNADDVTTIQSNWDQVIDNFDDMNLDPRILRGIYAYGFERPSAIQQRAIIPVVNGSDVIAQAQSGTGKTATFSVGILQRLATLGSDSPSKSPQAIILAPTRELAVQINRVVTALGDYLDDITSLALVGGTNIREQMAQLASARQQGGVGIQIVVATPGRLIDMIKRGALKVDNLRVLCMDEADDMLSKGFKDQIYEIFQLIPPNQDLQVALFSATMPSEVLELSTKFMRDPVTRILVKKDELTLEGIRQFYVAVEKEEWKLDTLCDLYDTISVAQSVIFVNSRRKVDWLMAKMEEREFTVSAMHGEMPQAERSAILKQFHTGATRVLISTDLLARGIDVQQVSLVVNYDMPTVANRENYLHRIGRGGRFGRKGVAINFVTTGDIESLNAIMKFYSTQIDEMPMDIADYL
ncbi:hypothetical protein D9758_000081 [Tetrapyrgos nigripes]|uniref:ATP-dependent RNA helicase FAL1 n=1 Tax=Tetrapyrgos nigripes TaxID=182062 RepID=A0A8H5H1W9_9AGAR|nr:hypothetical protein D9758_000081 [Tetrapyrgos nigripes]